MLRTTLLMIVLATAAPLAAQHTEIARIARLARDADLRGDWYGLIRSHEALEALEVTGPDRAWVDYYLGYVDWRGSSLAYIGEGQPASVGMLAHAGRHFERALAANPDMADARILLALSDGFQIGAQPDRARELRERVRANLTRAINDGPDNPRVKLISAMMTYFSPSTAGATKDSAMAVWRETAETFPRPAAGLPEWGRAEAWGWLGGALLMQGDTAGARLALEAAIADRPDFWWATSIALPQTMHSRLRHEPVK